MSQLQDVNTDETIDIKASTAICEEIPCEQNPYVADKRRLAGYDIEQLVDKACPTDILFLQYTGELPPSDEHRRLLEMLSIYLSTPSPRESASRAAMACGVSKTNAEHLLPIALMSAGGRLSGAAEVEECYRFLDKHSDTPPVTIANQLIEKWQSNDNDQSHERHIAPGFGRLYNDIDHLTGRILYKMAIAFPQGRRLAWVVQFNKALSEFGLGMLEVGLTAAVCAELGLKPRESVGLYQLFKAPGLLAYAMEQTHRPVSSMPMMEDDNYELGE